MIAGASHLRKATADTPDEIEIHECVSVHGRELATAYCKADRAEPDEEHRPGRRLWNSMPEIDGEIVHRELSAAPKSSIGRIFNAPRAGELN